MPRQSHRHSAHSVSLVKKIIQDIIIRVSAPSIVNKKIKQSGIVVIWMDIDDPSVVENLWYVRQNYFTKEWHICENYGISLHTSPIVVVQLRLICSSPSCGSSRILATKAVTIERPASLRANLEKMAKMRKEKRQKKRVLWRRPIGILDRSWLLRHPPAQVTPRVEWNKTFTDPQLSKTKTSAASLAGQVKKRLQPPPTTCSQIQPTTGFRKRIQTHATYHQPHPRSPGSLVQRQCLGNRRESTCSSAQNALK